MTIKIVSDTAGLLALEGKWRRLERSAGHITPFQMYEWVSTWWRHFGSGELRVFIFEDKEEIVGLVPAFLHEWNGRRQLTLLGSGISDFLDPAIVPDYAREVCCRLWELLNRSRDWDICTWQDLSTDVSLRCKASEADLAFTTLDDLPCSEIILAGGFADYWQQRPSGLRRNVRRYREKAEQIAPLDISVVDSACPEALDALIRLHSARWREQGEPGMIAQNRSAAFLREIVAKFGQRGLLLFFTLRFQGQIAAVIMGFPYRRTIYAYLSAFDPVHAAFGFGRILLFESLQYAFEHEFERWNFLRGEEAYKQEWGARRISKVRLIIERRRECV